MREDFYNPGNGVGAPRAKWRGTDWKHRYRFMIGVQSESDLFEVVATLHPSGCFARSLHCREQERNENPDDRDDDQELD
jgi:hypothetical protein